MTTFLLIRHGAHVLGGGTIAGRSERAILSEIGRRQAELLAGRIAAANVPIQAIYSSPVIRARQTAEPLAQRLGLPIETADELAEIDFGEWSGQAIESLRPLEPWKHFHTFRSGARIPGGERILETQSRIVHLILDLHQGRREQTIALVSHGDVIKSAVAYFLGVPLDLMLRIEISLASVSAVGIGNHGPWVLSVNNTGDNLLPWPVS